MSPKSNKEWTDELISLLGSITDQSFSDQFGFTVAQVRFKRRSLRIARYSPLRKPPEGVIEHLGKYPDTVLAKKTGLSLHKIRSMREAFDIPACYHQRSTFRRIDLIKQMVAEGRSIEEISREMKIPAERLSRFINRS